MKRYFSFISLLLIGHLTNAQTKVPLEEVAKHVGETVTVHGKVFDGKYLDWSASKPTLLNIGAAFPNHLLTVAIADSNRSKFSYKPEEFFVNKTVWVTGTVTDYKNKPQIMVSGPSEIKVDDSVLPPAKAN
jgi:DNA/RNA endonuclease YhcR with UshA esterase domain